MLAIIASVCLPIILSLMAFIPYKYPFNNKTGQVTKVARFFGLLVILSMLFSVYLAYDNYESSKDNKGAQASLKDTIVSLNHNIRSLSNKIDSVGYKIDKSSGKLVSKNQIITHYVRAIKQRHLTSTILNNILFKVPPPSGDQCQVAFEVANDNDKEVLNYIKQIAQALKRKGYNANTNHIITNREIHGLDTLEVLPPSEFCFTIRVYPESNVQ